MQICKNTFDKRAFYDVKSLIELILLMQFFV